MEISFDINVESLLDLAYQSMDCNQSCSEFIEDFSVNPENYVIFTTEELVKFVASVVKTCQPVTK